MSFSRHVLPAAAIVAGIVNAAIVVGILCLLAGTHFVVEREATVPPPFILE